MDYSVDIQFCENMISDERAELVLMKRLGIGVLIGGIALIAASIVAAGFQAGDLSTWGMRLLGAFTTVMAGVPYTISAKRKHKISALAHARDMMARAGQDGATDKIRQCAAQAQEWLWGLTQRNIRSFG